MSWYGMIPPEGTPRVLFSHFPDAIGYIRHEIFGAHTGIIYQFRLHSIHIEKYSNVIFNEILFD